jgi:hypothetical protein
MIGGNPNPVHPVDPVKKGIDRKHKEARTSQGGAGNAEWPIADIPIARISPNSASPRLRVDPW